MADAALKTEGNVTSLPTKNKTAKSTGKRTKNVKIRFLSKLRHRDGLKNAEIGKIFGVSLGTVNGWFWAGTAPQRVEDYARKRLTASKDSKKRVTHLKRIIRGKAPSNLQKLRAADDAARTAQGAAFLVKPSAAELPGFKKVMEELGYTVTQVR